ncbi:MAG: hypothetical protein SGI72_06070 [Planctomycetota bacterium]|nr:hypothetical protein [Planctomycetota bacterium]
MTRPDGERAGGRAARSIWIGPGERLRPLSLVLAGLGVAVRDIDDLASTANATGADDIEVVLDADLIPIEDVGYLKRFLSESGRSRVALVGHDAGTRVVRTVLALPRSRWMPWPPLLDDLIAMAGVDGSLPNQDRRRVQDRARAERTRTERVLHEEASLERSRPDVIRSTERAAAIDAPHRFVPEHDPIDDELDAAKAFDEVDEIQALLERSEPDLVRAPIAGEPRSGVKSVVRIDDEDDDSVPNFAPDSGTERASASEPDFADFDPEIPSHSSTSEPKADTNAVHPPWWRAQIADLADTAQRVELGLQALRMVEPDSHEEVREHVDQLDGEVARLMQFARTLGYVAAPPARGDQVFDLGDTVQVFVAQLASRPEATPRCQFRSSEPVFVRSDRALLGQAFDAFFWLAGACSAKGDLVRAQVIRDGGPAEVRVEFNSGPLDRIETARILEPYGLRRVLPDLGPNALSAASSIVAGQGGSVELSRVSNGRLAWRIVLPAVDRPTPTPSKKRSK